MPENLNNETNYEEIDKRLKIGLSLAVATLGIAVASAIMRSEMSEQKDSVTPEKNACVSVSDFAIEQVGNVVDTEPKSFQERKANEHGFLILTSDDIVIEKFKNGSVDSRQKILSEYTRKNLGFKVVFTENELRPTDDTISAPIDFKSNGDDFSSYAYRFISTFQNVPTELMEDIKEVKVVDEIVYKDSKNNDQLYPSFSTGDTLWIDKAMFMSEHLDSSLELLKLVGTSYLHKNCNGEVSDGLVEGFGHIISPYGVDKWGFENDQKLRFKMQAAKATLDNINPHIVKYFKDITLTKGKVNHWYADGGLAPIQVS